MPSAPVPSNQQGLELTLPKPTPASPPLDELYSYCPVFCGGHGTVLFF